MAGRRDTRWVRRESGRQTGRRTVHQAGRQAEEGRWGRAEEGIVWEVGCGHAAGRKEGGRGLEGKPAPVLM